MASEVTEIATVRIHDLCPRRALITRDSARPIGRAVVEAISGCGHRVALDFSGVDAVTPSFVDEVLIVLDEALTEAERASLQLSFVNPPTRLSAKFAAVGRSHNLSIEEVGPREWLISRSAARAAV